MTVGTTVYPLDAKTRAGAAAVYAELEWLREEANALKMEAEALESIAAKYAMAWRPLWILRRWEPVASWMKKEKKLKQRAEATRVNAAAYHRASMSLRFPSHSRKSDSWARRKAVLFRKNAAYSRKRASVWGSDPAKWKALAAAWEKVAATEEKTAEAWEAFAGARAFQGTILPAHYGIWRSVP